MAWLNCYKPYCAHVKDTNAVCSFFVQQICWHRTSIQNNSFSCWWQLGFIVFTFKRCDFVDLSKWYVNLGANVDAAKWAADHRYKCWQSGSVQELRQNLSQDDQRVSEERSWAAANCQNTAETRVLQKGQSEWHVYCLSFICFISTTVCLLIYLLVGCVFLVIINILTRAAQVND